MRLLFLLFLLAGPLTAQPADSSEVRLQPFPYGTSLTVQSILAEARALRPIPPAPPDSTSVTADPFAGIGRLVVDETISRTGSYFYDVFFQLWRPPDEARFVSVVLAEQPLPGQGTLVSVRLDGELVFQSRLPPREDEAEAVARQAVGATLRRLR
ncbi:CsgE family curli-type amyloid fiber assembly protein [Rubrivirga sp.]|uniref:CsgE family curli-type amyloid fiber assembly protein n=1 Tax=Rubrivirga sp. TaxID=1885344 RepID=UPI003C736CAF